MLCVPTTTNHVLAKLGQVRLEPLWQKVKLGKLGGQPKLVPITISKAEDYGSPQGNASRFSVDVPDDFCQTKDYLDTREVYGLKFPKKVQPSAWASAGWKGGHLHPIAQNLLAGME